MCIQRWSSANLRASGPTIHSSRRLRRGLIQALEVAPSLCGQFSEPGQYLPCQPPSLASRGAGKPALQTSAFASRGLFASRGCTARRSMISVSLSSSSPSPSNIAVNKTAAMSVVRQIASLRGGLLPPALELTLHQSRVRAVSSLPKEIQLVFSAHSQFLPLDYLPTCQSIA